ncbi:MAG: ABC transporter permease, partial [Saprospiraceae bacterium]|nr:ABC transporter permease [Saprospiraceae bacterium]
QKYSLSSQSPIETTLIKKPIGIGSEGIRQFVAYGGAIFIYFFIFLYGIQVMKGVIEEKTNRIVEVLLVSVKPIELMLGKIFGLSLLGFTQFFIWLIFSSLLGIVVGSKLPIAQLQQVDLSSTSLSFEWQMLFHSLFTMNWVFIVASFLLCFLLGYLLYSALFAVIGSASDVDTDTQQFLFPLTTPLLLSVMALPVVISNPSGTLAHILSFIPFTSPITLMARVTFLEQNATFLIEFALAIIVLILSVFTVIWMASKVYKIGIMTYGQKIGYKQIFSWLVQRD